MFSVSHGWLRYAPHAHFQLPEVVRVVDHGHVTAASCDGTGVVVEAREDTPVTVPICDKSGNIRFTRPLYRLKWPGEYSEHGASGLHDKIPLEILCNWPGLNLALSDYSLMDLVQQKVLPEVLPDCVAYHLAVNHHVYYPEAHDPQHPSYGLPTLMFPHPVGALWADRLSQVLHARFALDEHAVGALAYLKWLAEGHRPHPLLTGFDTMVRDKLLDVGETCVRLFFWLLQDYIYDPDTRYWAKSDEKHCWWQLAGYLFWLGRTGGGIVAKTAGIESGDEHYVERFLKVCPEVVEAIGRLRHDHTARERGHVTGKDPCVGDGGIFIQVKEPTR